MLEQLGMRFQSILFLIVIGISLTSAQVCTDSGRVVGLDLVERYGGSYNSDDTIILHEYGAINCFGVVTEWKFAKSTDCASVYFQIWRPEGTYYELVGQNFYDHTKESCLTLEIKQATTFKIPKHEQIPVQPNDIIGWTSRRQNTMIKYITSGAQEITKTCDALLDAPTTPGFSTADCRGATKILFRDILLQAVVVTGPVPVFANLPAIIRIPENSMNNTPDGFPAKCYDVKASIETSATDPNDNTPLNAANVPLNFSFSSPQLYFDITTELYWDDAFINETKPYTGRVTVSQELDYENQQEHEIPIQVYGLGQYAESTLTVQVIDMNEPHVILNLPYTTSVNAEIAKAGDIVFKVEVFDIDSNPDPLTYAIYSTNTLDPPPPFKMDSKTGILTVSEDLYGMILPNRFVLELAVWDFTHNVYETLTIDLVKTTKDPDIQNLPNTIWLPEDTPTGSDIFQVVTESRFPTQVEYSIIGITPFEMYNKFIIEPQSGLIKTTDDPEFNYGDKNQWPVYIEVGVCDDVGTDSGILTINLSWINRPPAFTPSVCAIDIPEKCGGDPCQLDATHPWTVPGFNLMVVHRDGGVFPDNGDPVDMSVCSILPGFASSMFIFEDCMYLRLIERIDVNSNPEYMTINLTLLVKDNYDLSDTADVFITVYDINDHKPEFDQTSYSAAIPENVPGGMSVLTVTATDKDFEENGTFVYGLSEWNPYNGTFYFQINHFTGVIYTKHPTDYELLMEQNGHNVIYFHVWAKDKGNPQKINQKDVSITIENANDNRPAFECVSNKDNYNPVDPKYRCFYNEDLRSDTLAEYTVLTLNAYDVPPENLIPTFYLLNPMNHFALNTTSKYTGDLHTIAQPLLEYHKYMMICMVEDQGQPTLKARPPVIVRVDTFTPEKHLVDITIDELLGEFNGSSNATIEAFMTDLYEYIKPWFPRLESIAGHSDSTVATIYALMDASSFIYENLDEPKNFVHVNDLLQKLRKNIYGDPKESFKTAMNDQYNPVLVMPTIPNWWIHTLGGLITTFMLLFLFLIFVIISAILLCRYFSLCCFKKRKIRPTTHAWMEDKRYLDQSQEDMRTIRESDEDRFSTDDENSRNDDDDPGSDDEDLPFSYSAMGKSESTRLDSADTVHSRIYMLSPMTKD